jgi:hypothetical protein
MAQICPFVGKMGKSPFFYNELFEKLKDPGWLAKTMLRSK